TSVFVRSLGWTFTHSIWQALVALIAAYTILALMKNAKSTARYNLLAATFIIFIGGVVITFVYELGKNEAAVDGISGTSAIQSIFYPGNYAATPVMVESKRIVDVLMDYFNQYLNVFVAVWFIVFCIKWLRLSLSLDY